MTVTLSAQRNCENLLIVRQSSAHILQTLEAVKVTDSPSSSPSMNPISSTATNPNCIQFVIIFKLDFCFITLLSNMYKSQHFATELLAV